MKNDCVLIPKTKPGMNRNLVVRFIFLMLSARLSVEDCTVNNTQSSNGKEDETFTCSYFCAANDDETEWISPPQFARPCIPREIQPIYYTKPDSDHVVINWTKPIATDRDGGSPSVIQVKGINNGGNFTGTLLGKTHTIVYIATDTDGLTDNCVFTFTVTIPSCSKLDTVLNGRYTCTNDTAPGSVCTFECHEGFMISGTGNEVYATCGYFPQTREFPIWKNVQQCKRIECGIPAVPEKAMLTCTNNEKTYQTVCNIDCYHGYSASGPTNIICQANGYWSKAAVCIGHIPEIRECSPSLCNGHTCLLNDNGTFSCDCSFGWTGPYCEDSPDMCVENICMNGAECNSLNKSYTCICQSGYSGSLCQVSPADGNWSDWSIWSKCSVTCGSGVRLRQRSCDNPPPDEHGKVCQGSNTENSDCENDRCEECPTLNINESLTFHECTTDTDTGLKTCEISCKNGTIQLDGFRTLRCGHGTNYYWAPANVLVLCLVPKIPEVYGLESEIMYSSSIPKEQQPEVEDHVRKNINDTSCIQSGYCNTIMTFIPNQVSDYTETKLILTFLRYLDYIVNSSGIMDQFVLDELQKAVSDLESTAKYLRNYTENVFNVNTNGGLIQADESSLHQQCFVNCAEGHISVNGVCVECPAGTYMRSNMCNAKGTFQMLAGQTACNDCPLLGHTTSTIGSFDEEQCFAECPPGTYFTETICIYCPKGTYQWLEEQTACVQCQIGHTTKAVGSVSRGQCFLNENKKSGNANIWIIVGSVLGAVFIVFVAAVIKYFCAKKWNSRRRPRRNNMSQDRYVAEPSHYDWFNVSDEDSDVELNFANDLLPRRESPSLSENETDEEEDGIFYGILPSLSDVDIARECVHVIKKLGEGAFGTVHRGILKTGNISVTVAIKTLKPNVMTSETFLDEARIMHKLNHDKLVKLIGVSRDKQPFLLITEYMCNGDLHKFLRRNRSTIKLRQMSYFASQIADGMNYLGLNRFIHRDLRCANVLVGKQHLVKIADFGLARLVDRYEEYTGGPDSVFPILWTAPDARISRIFTIQSDVWSFGVLLYEMITYGGLPREDMKASVMQKPKPAHWPKGYFECMGACLNDDPNQRPTFLKLRSFFEDYGNRLAFVRLRRR